ncbi:uncharacterized protein LOC135195600 [Macrobrachium nipponense]|uniref:uncharacterized protein LOC135195600 n=1 Tax=Macrobrachium nipponense TaxID=159736 RepID=UPI0030C7D528
MTTLKLMLLLTALAIAGASTSSGGGVSDLHSGWNVSPNFEHLRRLMQEGDVRGFQDGAKSLRQDLPDLQDLADMANDVFSGKEPRYVQDNNYTLSGNASLVSFNMTGMSIVDQKTASYAAIQNEGDRGSVSILDFYNVSGTVGNFSFTSGYGFHTYGRYTTEGNSVRFETSAIGAALYKLPNGIFIMFGNYTGVSEGNGARTRGEITEASAVTLGFMNTPYYTSRNIMHQNGRYTANGSHLQVNSFSVTGGTNSTVDMYTFYSPGMNSVQMHINGTLRNPDKEGGMMGTYEVSPGSLPPNEEKMTYVFSMTRLGAEVYLA